MIDSLQSDTTAIIITNISGKIIEENIINGIATIITDLRSGNYLQW